MYKCCNRCWLILDIMIWRGVVSVCVYTTECVCVSVCVSVSTECVCVCV